MNYNKNNIDFLLDDIAVGNVCGRLLNMRSTDFGAYYKCIR